MVQCHRISTFVDHTIVVLCLILTMKSAMPSSVPKPSALDVLFVFACGGLLAGAGEGVASFFMNGRHVPEIIWITAALYFGISMAACLLLWPLWRWRIGFLIGLALMAAAAPFGLLVEGVEPKYRGWLSANQGRLLGIAMALVFAALCTVWCVKSRERCMRWTRRIAVLVAAMLFLWAGASRLAFRPEASHGTASPASPNVIVIVVDTLRADHISAYGYARNTTPNLDRLASDGVIFENAISPSSWTLPGHASLVTGLYPREHHTSKLQDSIPASLPTLSEQFLARGYRTGAFSANTFFFGREHGFGRGFQSFGDYFSSVPAAFQHTELGRWTNQKLFDHGWYSNMIGRQTAASINQRGLSWIDRGSGPFFLMLNYFDVHDPYIPPAGAAQLWSKGAPVPPKRISETFNQYRPPSPQQVQYAIDEYDNSLFYVDSQIAALVKELQRRGLDRNTLVIVTADHGEEFDEQGILTHANALYLEEIRVPLIMWAPGKIPSGVRIARPVSTIDIGATALQIAGNSSAPTFPGNSLTAFWTNGDVQHWPYPISQLASLPIDRSFPNFFGSMNSIVTDQWHFVGGPGNREHLFACCTTGVDHNDVAANSDSKPLIEALRAEMRLSEKSRTQEIRAASGGQ